MSISYNDPTTKLTYDHYVLFPNDGDRHEIIHGRHHMHPAPSPRHQFASRHIQFQLFNQIELKGLGQVVNAPIDVQLSETDVVQPDLVVVLNDNRIITTTKVNGPPDLIVEILSPSNREYDQVLKKQLYEQYGVPEYWIVDPNNRTADLHVLAKESITYCVETCVTEIRFAKVNAVVNLGRVWL